MPELPEALLALVPGALFTYNGSYESMYWSPENTAALPPKSILLEKLAVLEKEYPMQLLRSERNSRLAKSDWIAIKYYTMNKVVPQNWVQYFQSLRDLPSLSSPTLNSKGQLDLTSVSWPTEPSET
jgi:hypothetical protein